ncbi:hypothetical protein [Streptomyces sp. GESEQ-35]|uniref:hypothetical protein n=1 Tax=Streptomyces sp. GESEQ-35 TaxID=2812657 RepID=UPI001B338C2A|nr:hypothetical protein [Streptomyces sp. GESEQ-35]
MGATAAAAALALGGTFTAHADNSGPAPEKSATQIKVDDVCAEPEPVEDPVEAVPGGDDDVAKPDSYKDATVDDEDPVDAEPVDDCVEDPEPGGDPVEAVPGGDDDLGKPDSYVDVEVGAVKH